MGLRPSPPFFYKNGFPWGKVKGSVNITLPFLYFYSGAFLILAKGRGYWAGVGATLRSTITA